MEKTKREQYVLSQTGKVLIGSYLSPKGVKLLSELNNLGLKTASKDYKARLKEIKRKYEKNRYVVNPDAHVVKKITHQPLTARQ
jgi:hypothetical protein